VADCIQAQITADIKSTLAGITIAGGYHYDVAIVEEQRKLLEINDRWPFVLILENEPITDRENLLIAGLVYTVWFFHSADDRCVGVVATDLNSEGAYLARNAMADIMKVLAVDTTRGIVTGTVADRRAELTRVIPGYPDMYLDGDQMLFGVFVTVEVTCNIDMTDPFQLRH
jgi:hypothetical protein